MDEPPVPAIIGSPKRKRALMDTGCRAASPLRPRMDGGDADRESASDTPLAPSSRAVRGASPQTHMSEEFRALHIHPPPFRHPQQLSFRARGGDITGSGGDGSRYTVPSRDADSDTLPASTSTSSWTHDALSSLSRSTPPPPRLAFPPPTPALYPVSPADTPQRTISPLPPLARDAASSSSSTADGRGAGTDGEGDGSALPMSPSKRPRSPPLPSVASPLTWTPAEITGHLGDDPHDDGTGINGIGFRPTPAVAQQRAARRRQQVADWKNREAREARSRRAERRGRGVPMSPTATKKDVGIAAPGLGEGLERRVRFVEG